MDRRTETDDGGIVESIAVVNSRVARCHVIILVAQDVIEIHVQKQ